MFLALDVDQKVILINRKGCEILGYKEEVIDKNGLIICFRNGIEKG